MQRLKAHPVPPVPPSTGQAESGCPTLQVHWGTRLSRLSDLSREWWAGPRCTGITVDLGSQALPHALLRKPRSALVLLPC